MQLPSSVLMLVLCLAPLAAQAQLLNCSSHGRNPSYDLSITAAPVEGRLTGHLEQVMIGFIRTPNDRTSLGRDPLLLSLNPARCELTITSQLNPADEFAVVLPLRTEDVDLTGQMRGSLFGTQGMTCSRADGDLVRALKQLCDSGSSLDTRIQFRTTREIIRAVDRQLNAVNDDTASDEQGPERSGQGPAPAALAF